MRPGFLARLFRRNGASFEKSIESKTEVTPWARPAIGAGPGSRDLRLVCVLEVNMLIESFQVLLCYQRRGAHDELWQAMFYCDEEISVADLTRYSSMMTRVARAPRCGSRKHAARRLFKRLLRAIGGHGSPREFIAGGLIDRDTYLQLLAEIRAEQERAVALARARETPLIAEARRLGLRPEPSGRSPYVWLANCPGRGHRLHIDTSSDLFGCGYCKRKGGLAKLEEFVAERTGVPASGGLAEPKPSKERL